MLKVVSSAVIPPTKHFDSTRLIGTLDQSALRTSFIVHNAPIICRQLSDYYDIAAAADFVRNFSNTWIGSHKTPSANSFYVLRFDFSTVSAESLIHEIRRGLTDFCQRYDFRAGYDVVHCNFVSPVPLFAAFTRTFIQHFDGQILLLLDDCEQTVKQSPAAKDKKPLPRSTSPEALKLFYTYVKDKFTEKLIARLIVLSTSAEFQNTSTSGISVGEKLPHQSTFASVFGTPTRHFIISS